MFVTLSGRVVGVNHEVWGGGDTGKPFGERIDLYLQQHPTGASAPVRVSIDPAFKAGVDESLYGRSVSVPVFGRAWADGRVATMLFKSTGLVAVGE